MDDLPVFKILVVGDPGTGKTSVVHRYVDGDFSDCYKATIGVDFALKTAQKGNKTIQLQLWDIGGQERFGNMTKIYYKEAVGAFIVFDITKIQTFDAVRKWKRDMDAKITATNAHPIHVVLLANKCDMLRGDGIFNQQRAQMDEFCDEQGFIGWFETSAALDIGITEAADCLLDKIFETIPPDKPVRTHEKINVGNRRPQVEEEKCGC